MIDLINTYNYGKFQGLNPKIKAKIANIVFFVFLWFWKYAKLRSAPP